MTEAVETLLREWVEIDVPGAGKMQAYRAKSSGTGPWPAVIVLMEIFGVNSHIRDVAERIAAEGYVAIAPNYYHRTTPNMELGYTEADVATGRSHKEQTTRDGLLADIHAVLNALRDDHDISPKEKVGCIGFCFGGHVAYITAGLDEIAATTSFYGGGIAKLSPGRGPATVTHTKDIQGEMLCLFGETDPLISHEDTVIIENALKNAGIKHEIIRYPNIGHGFFCNQRGDYDPAAAADAWQRVKDLFARNLK